MAQLNHLQLTIFWKRQAYYKARTDYESELSIDNFLQQADVVIQAEYGEFLRVISAFEDDGKLPPLAPMYAERAINMVNDWYAMVLHRQWLKELKYKLE